MLDMWQGSSKRDFPQYHGGRPHIYSAQKAHTVGDVGHIIPRICADVDNRQADHQASILRWIVSFDI